MTKYLDYGYGTVAAGDIVRAGAVGICRYLSNSPGKNLTAPERDAALAHNLDIVLVWESTATRSSEGSAAGTADGQLASGEAKGLGAPAGMTIYAATDQDTTWADVAPYHTAFNAAVAKAGYVGDVYGGYTVVRDAHLAGAAPAPWQTSAWSHGNVLAAAALVQNNYHAPVSGVDCDSSDVQHAPNGWRANLAKPVVNESPLLHLGDRGPKVADVQRALNMCGNELVEDGIFGADTDRILRVFQAHRDLEVTGSTTAETWTALRLVAHPEH
ncbi:hypothetical protein acdb102_31120 [Acidothermaceae bacterium B102]|nr:hypothetical protein acdb102_31120 [Acidothermaceae bacterium B102]